MDVVHIKVTLELYITLLACKYEI